MRALAAAALLLAGCLQEEPSTSAEDALACAHPDAPGGACPYPRMSAGCADLRVEPSGAGDAFEIAARLTNACDGSVWHQGLNMGEAEREGMAAWILVDGTRYHFLAGAAWDTPTVAPALPPGRLMEPGATIEARWPWNGTVARSLGHPCYCTEHERVAPGAYEVGAVVVRLPNVTTTTTLEIV